MIFSIVVPFYNTPLEMIGPLVEQLKSLDKNIFEVILVNDGSNDKVSQYVKDIIPDSFKYYSYKPNCGVSHARNIGIKKATGDFLLFVDSDDLIDVKLLNSISKIKQSQLSIFISDVFFTLVKDTDKPLEEIISDSSLDQIYINCDIKGIAMRSACGKIFSRKIIIDNNLLFDEDLPFYEDAMFVSNYYLKVKEFIIYNNVLYHYRMNPKSSSKKFNKNYMEKFEIFFEKYKSEFFENSNFISALYFDTFRSVLVSKVVVAFKKAHLILCTKICKNKCVIESANYLFKNNLLDSKYEIKLASLIIKRHNILASNKIILNQIFGSLKIRLKRLVKH